MILPLADPYIVVGVEIYINDDKETFNRFKEQSDEIEQYFGAKLEWIDAPKASRILATTAGDIKSGTDTWPTLFDWYMKAAVKMREITQKFDS